MRGSAVQRRDTDDTDPTDLSWDLIAEGLQR